MARQRRDTQHLIASGKVRLAPLLSARLPLSRYAEGVALLLRHEALKVLFILDDTMSGETNDTKEER